jgi:hypothetical protein
MDEFTQYEVAPASPAGAGRGVVNPAPVSQYTYAAPTQPQYPVTPAQSAVEGGARGVTAGTFDYLPAGMAYAWDRLRKKMAGSNATPISFDEALAASRAHSADSAQQNPGSYMGGNIAGGAALAYGTGGASLQGQVASQAVIGAVEKAATDPNATLGDIAMAGGENAVLTGVVGGAGKVVANKLAAMTEAKMATQMASRNKSALADNAKALKEAQAAHQKATNEWLAAQKTSPNYIPTPPPVFVPPVPKQVFSSVEDYAAQQAQKSVKQLTGARASKAVSGAVDTAKNVGLTALGGTAGYYAGPYVGLTPQQGAALGSGGTGATLAIAKAQAIKQMGNAAKDTAYQLANKFPNVVPNAASGVRVIANGVDNVAPPYTPPEQDTGDEFSQYEIR